MKYLLMVALFAFGISVGILITPEAPKGYQGFVSVELCNERIQTFESIAERCIDVANGFAKELDACLNSK